MITINNPDNEKERLNSLHSYKVLDSIPEIDFDDVILLASQICKTSIAYICLIDDERQWFKSTKGFNIKESTLNTSICSYAISFPEDILIIPNLLDDERFYDHPIATGQEQIKFYASVPLINADGYALGTICVLDKKERKLTAKQAEAMQSLSRQVMNAIEIRKQQSVLKQNNKTLKAKAYQFEKFAIKTVEEISSPLNSMSMLTNMLKTYIESCDKEKVNQYTKMIEEAALNIVNQLDDLKVTYRHMDIISQLKTKIDFNNLIERLVENDGVIKQKANIKLPKETEYFFENAFLLKSIIEETLKLIIAVNQKKTTNFNFTIDKTKDNFTIKIIDDSNRSMDFNAAKNSTVEFINNTTNASKWIFKITYNEGIGHLMKLIIPR